VNCYFQGKFFPPPQYNAFPYAYVYTWNNKHKFVKDKNKVSFFQRFRRCDSGAEWDLWCISVTSFCLFCVVEHHVLKKTFVFQPIFPHFSGILDDQRPPPVIASDNASVVFFDDTSWRSSAATPLVKLGLLSSLRTSMSVTTCSSIFCPFTGSAEMSPVDFTATVK